LSSIFPYTTLFRSRISPACVTQRSQICAPSPAMSIKASFLLIPQNEHLTSLLLLLIFTLLFLFSELIPHQSCRILWLQPHASNSLGQKIIPPIRKVVLNVQKLSCIDLT